MYSPDEEERCVLVRPLGQLRPLTHDTFPKGKGECPAAQRAGEGVDHADMATVAQEQETRWARQTDKWAKLGPVRAELMTIRCRNMETLIHDAKLALPACALRFNCGLGLTRARVFSRSIVAALQ